MSDMHSTFVDFRPKRAPSVAIVGTARCISYNLSRVRQAVYQCVQELPDMQERLAEARCVLLKPNLLSSRAGPEDHVNTHPAVVQALAELLINDFDCEVAVGDSCGTLSEGSTALAIANSGMDRAAEAAGARLYNVDTQPRHVAFFPQGRVFKDIPLPSNLEQFDLVISVAKLKTHNLTYVTGPVKNMLGLVPGAGKKQAHLLAPRVEEFSTLLCDLYELLRPGAAFVDGVIGMEGRGPANGSLRHLELLAASCDPVALDSFCSQVMGFEPLSIPLLAQCQERGLGVAAPAGITVRGEPASAFAPDGFARPPTYASSLALRIVPRWLFRGAFGAMTTRRAEIDQDACRRCGECAHNCPSQAIRLDEAARRYEVEPRECIACYCCTEVCPYDAVRVRRSRIGAALNFFGAPLRALGRRA
jgi:uncharacterized protein (DUF362 family)/Pyruvate/2-oxoacid:ferredoxin oxidoreductase delta subunit